MPKQVGQPITITNGHAQRENVRFQVEIQRDNAGNKTYVFSGFGAVRLRDAGAVGNIVYQDPTLIPIVTLVGTAIPASAIGWFDQIDQYLDTQ